jgi:hypothetical protein
VRPSCHRRRATKDRSLEALRFVINNAFLKCRLVP